MYSIHGSVGVCVAGLQDLSGSADLYGTSPGGAASYGGGHLRGPPLPSQAMLLPGHPHAAMMMAHGGHMAAHHPGMYGLPAAMQGPTALHPAVDAMGHVQDIHAR